MGAGYFREKRFFVFNDLPCDGGTGLPWIGPDVVEHGTKVLIRALKEIKILLGFAWGGKEASQSNRVVGLGASIPNVSSFVTILNIFGGPPGVKLSERCDSSANWIEGFDWTAGAKEKLKSLDPFAFGLGSSCEGSFSGVDRSPLNQVG